MISVEWNVESVSVVNTAGVTGRVTLFLTTGMSRFFAKLGLSSESCGLLKIVSPEFCFDFLIARLGPSQAVESQFPKF